MKVLGTDNLFCAGEKSGLFVGHTEAIATGTLAGHNAVRNQLGIPLLTLPRNLAVGDLIAYANEKVQTTEGRRNRYTFAGAEFFKRMIDEDLYIMDSAVIQKKVAKLDLDDIFNEKLL